MGFASLLVMLLPNLADSCMAVAMAVKLETAAGDSWTGKRLSERAAVRQSGGRQADADSCMLAGISISSPCGGRPAVHYFLGRHA